MVNRVPGRWDHRRFRRVLCVAVVLAGGIWGIAQPAHAQLGFSVPSQVYYSTFSSYWDGDYREALNEFQGEARGGIKSGTNRWIDSICYFTMVGECYYQLGQHQAALTQFTSALGIYYAFNDWMVRVQFQPGGIRPSNPGEFRALPWGRSTRAFVLGHYPDTIPIMQGQFTNLQSLLSQGGGVPSAPMGYSVGVQEIVRCTALAMRRRREIMGPACAQDQLTNDLVTALARRPGPANHWSECWIDLQLGIALSCAGKNDQARVSIERSLLAAGQFDHPLTGMGFLELARLALLASDFESAANFAAEATYSAACYKDPVVVEEAFRAWHLAHLMGNKPGIIAPLTAATMWAKASSLRQLNVWSQLLAAECYCVMGQPQNAANLLTSAASSIGRRGMALGKVGARLNFLSALAAYQQSNVTLGDQKLTQAMAFQKNGSLRLFHIALADTLYTDGTVSPRVAMDLYSAALRDPTPLDWAVDPLEALSLLAVPHPNPYEHWFEVAIDRKDHERVLEISDLARRHRFLSTLDFGGRIHNLRWLLEGPEDNLDQAGRLERQDLLARYPDYDKLHQEAQKLHLELKQQPLVPDGAAATREQNEKLARLAEISESQELVLRQMAVRREPCSLVFPPIRATKDVKAALAPGHALLSFFATPRQSYALLLTHDKYGYWKIPRDESLAKPIMKLLQSLGSVDGNRQITLKELEATGWKEQGQQILSALTKDSRADWKSFTQLIIVPDGSLWYLPFEVLPIAEGDELVPLGHKMAIRYAPLVSLGMADPRPRRAGGTTAVVVGKLMLSGDATQSDAAFQEIGHSLPGAVALKPPIQQDTAEYSTLFDGLIVLNEVAAANDSPYDWSPVPHDQKSAGSLADWFALPWGGPDFIILPSFHTAAERAMKKQASEPGNEIFLSVCGLMANGVRTILMTRWRTGGQSSVDLVREFVQELPHSSAADAWQRSVAIASENPLNAVAEPRLRLTPSEEPPNAEHPFFWGGYLLVDTGTLPQELADQQPKAAEPDAGPKRPNPPLAGNGPGAAQPVPGAGLARPSAGQAMPGGAQPPVNGLGGFGAVGNEPAGGGPGGAKADGANPGAGQPPAQNPGFGNPGGVPANPAGNPGGNSKARNPGAGKPAGNNPAGANPLFDNMPKDDGAAGMNDGTGKKSSKQSSSKKPPRKPKTPKKYSDDGFPDEGGFAPANPWADDMQGDGQTPPKKPRTKTSNSKASKSSSSKAARAKAADPDAPPAEGPTAPFPPPANP